MANIVGLGSTQDPLNSTGQRKLRENEKLKDGLDVVKPVDLKPVAAPVDTYARPASAPINHDLENLISGLSSLNAGLQQFSAAQAAEKKKPADRDKVQMALANAKEEDIPGILARHPALQSDTARQYAGQVLAQKYADQDGLTLRQFYDNDFDKANGQDLAQQIGAMRQRRLEQLGSNPGFADAYIKQFDGYQQGILGQHQKFLTEQNQNAKSITTGDSVSSLISSSVNGNESLEDFNKRFSTTVDLNKFVNGQDYKTQMGAMTDAMKRGINMMDQFPEKRNMIWDRLNSIVNTPRKGQDGVERTLADLPNGVGDAYKGLLADATKRRNEINGTYIADKKATFTHEAETNPMFDFNKAKEWSAAEGNAFSAPELQGLYKKNLDLRQKEADKQAGYQAQEQADGVKNTMVSQDMETFENGDFLFPKDKELPNKNAFLNKDPTSVEKVTGDKRKDDAYERYSQKLDADMDRKVAAGMPKEQAKSERDATELATVASNGYLPKQWKDRIEAGANTLTTAGLSNSKEMPQPAIDALRQVKLLKAQAPHLLSQVLDKNTRDLFDVAMTVPGNETEQLRTAILYEAKKDEGKQEIAAKKIDKAMASMDPKWFGSTNMSELRPDIKKRAVILMQARGLNEEDALKASAKSLEGRFVSIHGRAIPTDDKRLPPQFGDLAERYLNKLVEVGGVERWGVKSASDLTLNPRPDGSWEIINKNDGYLAQEAMPFVWKDGSNRDARFITPDMIQDMAVERRQVSEQRATRRSQENKDSRFQPLFTIPGTTVSIPKPTQTYSREELLAVKAKGVENETKRAAASQAKAGQNRDFVETVNRNAAAARAEQENPSTPLTVGRGRRIR